MIYAVTGFVRRMKVDIFGSVRTQKMKPSLCVCILGFSDLFMNFVVQANAAIAGIDSCCVVMEPGESKCFD